jgi:hypothetical protein
VAQLGKRTWPNSWVIAQGKHALPARLSWYALSVLVVSHSGTVILAQTIKGTR